MPLNVARPLTPFERKYRDSGHNLRACRLRIRPAERKYWSMATTRTAKYNQLVATNPPCDNLSAPPSKL